MNTKGPVRLEPGGWVPAGSVPVGDVSLTVCEEKTLSETAEVIHERVFVILKELALIKCKLFGDTPDKDHEIVAPLSVEGCLDQAVVGMYDIYSQIAKISSKIG